MAAERKRPKGSGSIEEVSKGKFQIRVCLGYDPFTKKYRRVKETIQGTRKEAEARLREILYQRDTQTLVLEPQKMTLRELLQQWLATNTTGEEANFSPKTAARYEELIRVHILPALGDVPVAKLTASHIQQFYNQKRSAGGRADGNGGLAAATVRKLHNVLHAALEYAVRLQLLPENPAKRVIKPKVPAPGSKIKPLNEQEVRRFMTAAKGSRFHPFFVVTLGTGFRPEELLGLKWTEIDLEARKLTVAHTVTMVKGKPLLKDIPKTASSRRTIEVGDEVVKALKTQKARQNQQKLAWGEAYQDYGLVFASENGTPLNECNVVKRYFKPMLQKAGLPDIRLYDLRHTHATLMIKRGEDVKMVSQRLGHTSVAFTLDTYHHVLPGVEKEAVMRFDSLLQG